MPSLIMNFEQTNQTRRTVKTFQEEGKVPGWRARLRCVKVYGGIRFDGDDVMKWKRINGLAKETFNEVFEDRAFRLGAALAYYSIFSIAPLLIIVIALAGVFLRVRLRRDQIQQQVHAWVVGHGTRAVV